MSLSSITIDSFTNTYGSYVITYTPSTASIDVAFTGDFESTLLTADQRGGRSDGEFITTITVSGSPISFYASLSSPFATIGSSGDGGGSGGDGGSDYIPCDIAITAITTTNQSVPGLNDGGITIAATSSNSPIQYSINNSTWFSSGVFTGLPGGTGIAFVKDASGCLANQTYTVATSTPTFNRLVSSPAVGSARWSALFNPIVFGYQSPASVPGRKFITEITSGYDGATSVITATHSANLTGYCRADISKYLRTLLQPVDALDYTAINYRDANISASYTVRYKEVWDGGQTDWISAGDPYYVTYSAMQIGNPTGGNMQPYVTFADAGQTNPAKFLNDFATPVFYTDMPWDISFIYSEKVAGYQLKLGGNGIDINGKICGALGETMLLNENGSVLLNEDGSLMLIEKEATGVLYNKLGVNRLRITPSIPANSIWLDIFLFYTDGSGTDIPVTENRRLLLDNSPCNALPYEYLKWMGPTGGWLYYMFTTNQFHEVNTSNNVVIDRFIADYASADSTQQLISIGAQKKITVGKNDIPASEADVLATLLYSPKVYRLVNAATNTWQGVIVDTTSLKLYQTYGQTGDFEISYLLPAVNVQCA